MSRAVAQRIERLAPFLGEGIERAERTEQLFRQAIEHAKPLL
jgi:hypothetical protein